MTSVDVLVVGAGPAGSTAAERLARQGHSVLVIEEHGRIGYPVQCAGLVSRRVLDLSGAPQVVRRPVHGATVYSPALRSITFRAAEPRAYVIDRAGLDIALAEKAATAGAVFETNTRFDGLVGTPNGIARVKVTREGRDSEELEAKLVVGADGVSSAVARAFRLRRPVEILPAFEAEFPESPGDPDLVEVYLGTTIAPGLFGWWIPDGSGGARVGVAASADGTSARVYYERLLAQIARRYGRALCNPTSYLVSGIPIGELPRFSAPRVMLVGDAAAQPKPLSGGGIFTGMRAAELAAEVAHGALTDGDFSGARLSRYDAAWRREFGEEFDKAQYLRRLFLKFTDRELEAILEALEEAGTTETIVAFGDIDFPTHVVRRLLRQSPSLLRLLPKAVGALWGRDDHRAPDLDFASERVHQ
ncbi:MAG: NAD(P)/FAD-dependent oxidoreductase [Thermoplasmata archaeon]|nr:NAD(P)/FAD-dependent oxidoreductase [Thermoplasmata archaeon]